MISKVKYPLSIGRADRSTQQGFGIIEVVITLFIIGATLLLFQVVSNSVVLNKYNRYKETALRVAEHQLQVLRITPYASLPSSGSFNHALLTNIPQGTGSMTITETETGISQVTVVVSWRNPSGTANQQVTLSSFVSSGGLGK